MEDQSYCPNCGAEIDAGEKICSECGKKKPKNGWPKRYKMIEP